MTLTYSLDFDNSQESIPMPDSVSPTNYPPLPTSLDPYPVISNIAFAEGPIFDDRGDLYFVNYLELGTLGRFASDGTVEVWEAAMIGRSKGS